MKNTYIVILTTLSAVLFWMGGTSVYAQDGERTRNPLETTVTEQGDTVRVQRNPETGTAHRVYGMSKNVRQYDIAQEGLRRNSIPEFSQALFEDYANVLNIDPTTLTRERAQTDGDLWFVSYTQTVGGVPVYGTEIGYTIGKRGNVIALGAGVSFGDARHCAD